MGYRNIYLGIQLTNPVELSDDREIYFLGLTQMLKHVAHDDFIDAVVTERPRKCFQINHLVRRARFLTIDIEITLDLVIATARVQPHFESTILRICRSATLTSAPDNTQPSLTPSDPGNDQSEPYYRAVKKLAAKSI